ncbi:hypothetical protein Tco_0731155 [Tanacetum coccineum]
MAVTTTWDQLAQIRTKGSEKWKSTVAAYLIGCRAKSWTSTPSIETARVHHRFFIAVANINAKESSALLKDLALYDNESWNDLRDFTKPVKAILLPQDVPSTSDRRLIELENQVQCLMESHLAPRQPTQVNKIISLCESMSKWSHDTQSCMEITEQAFVERINPPPYRRNEKYAVRYEPMTKKL